MDRGRSPACATPLVGRGLVVEQNLDDVGDLRLVAGAEPADKTVSADGAEKLALDVAGVIESRMSRAKPAVEDVSRGVSPSWAGSVSHPDGRNVIGLYLGVCSENRDPFDDRLGDEKAVEGVPVMIGKIGNDEGVTVLDH